MFEEYPDIQSWNSLQDKLILRADPEERSSFQGQQPGQYVRPEQHIRRAQIAPDHPIIKLKHFWDKDPAHKFFILSIILVLITSTVFAATVGSFFLQAPARLMQNTSQQNVPSATQPTPAGTVDLRPTFPTPSGGKGGSKTSSLPPSLGTVIVPTVTATTPPEGSSHLQIVSFPQQVRNNSTARVTVASNQPGIKVRLVINYNAVPFYAESKARTTNGSGITTLSWNVRVFAFGRNSQGIIARVIAAGTDQSGQQVQSQPITVQIVN